METRDAAGASKTRGARRVGFCVQPMRNTTGEPTSRRILMMVLVASVGLRLTAGAQGIKLGVMGDSLSDEYSDWSDRATPRTGLSNSSITRGFDCGPTAVAAGQPGGTWGDVRGTATPTIGRTPWPPRPHSSSKGNTPNWPRRSWPTKSPTRCWPLARTTSTRTARCMPDLSRNMVRRESSPLRSQCAGQHRNRHRHQLPRRRALGADRPRRLRRDAVRPVESALPGRRET